MNPILVALAPIGLALTRTLINLLVSLSGEAFVKRMLVHGLRRIAKKTKATWDDEAARDLAKVWGVED